MSIFQLERDGDVDELARILETSNTPEVRGRAAEALGELAQSDQTDDSPIADALIEAAKSDDHPRVRAAAIDALDELGAEPIQRLLLELAGIDRQASGIDSDAFLQALEAELPELRMAGANAIGHAGDTSTLPALVDCLDDDHPRVRARAARALGRLGDRRALEPLAASTSDPTARVRRNAVEAIGTFGADAPVDVLLTRLEDGSDMVRRAAVQNLGSFTETGLLEPLVDMLEDDVDLVRQAAVHTIIDLLANVPPEESHELREEVVEAFAATADRVVVGPLVEILEESTQPHHRRNAAWLLGRVAGDDPRRTVIESLCSALADEDPMASQFATTSLVEIGSDRVETTLLDFLDREGITGEARGNAIFTLGKDGGERSRDRIERIVEESDDEEVHDQAYAALSKLGGTVDTSEGGETDAA